MSCVFSKGVVFCQLTPLGFLAVLFVLLTVGFLVGRAVQLFVEGELI